MSIYQTKSNPHQLTQPLLQDRTLELQHLDAFEKELVAVPLAGALDPEDEVVAHPAELDLVLELVVPETFAADGVAHWVVDDGADVVILVLVPVLVLVWACGCCSFWVYVIGVVTIIDIIIIIFVIAVVGILVIGI